MNLNIIQKMPNWVYNTIAIKGDNKSLLKFINKGLSNCNLSEETNLNSALNKLFNDGYVMKGCTTGTKDMEIKKCDGVRMSTWTPVPEIFSKYDTTNHPDDYPEIAKEQKEKYGVVGWYDYNIYVGFGCKWDTKIELDDHTDNYIVFYTETPWSPPEIWLDKLAENFPDLEFIMMSTEESNAFFSYLNSTTKECKEFIPEEIEWDDENEDAYYEAYEDEICRVVNDLNNYFYNKLHE